MVRYPLLPAFLVVLITGLIGSPTAFSQESNKTAPRATSGILYDLRVGDRLTYKVRTGSDWKVRVENRLEFFDPLQTSILLELDVKEVKGDVMSLEALPFSARVSYRGPGTRWSFRVKESGGTQKGLNRALGKRQPFTKARVPAEIAAIDEQTIGIGIGLLVGRKVAFTVNRQGGVVGTPEIPADVLATFPEEDRLRTARLLGAYLARLTGLVFPTSVAPDDITMRQYEGSRWNKRAKKFRAKETLRSQDEKYSFAGAHLWENENDLKEMNTEATKLLDSMGGASAQPQASAATEGKDNERSRQRTPLIDESGRTRFDLGLAWGPLQNGTVTKTDSVWRLERTSVINKRTMKIKGEASTQLKRYTDKKGRSWVRTLRVNSVMVWKAELIDIHDGGGDFISP